MHTNFKISSSGEELFLSDSGGNLLDQTEAIQLFADQSYDRIPDGSPNWTVINTPSPGASNNNSNELTFSHQEGFYVSPFALKINSLLADTVYYTLDGSIPTSQSNVFSDSLVIDFRKTDPNIFSEIPTTPNQNLISYKAWEPTSELIDKATTLRCISYKNNQPTSRVYTKTFFVDEEIQHKYTLPVISLVTESDGLFDADSGIYVPGTNYNSSDPEWSGNYFQRGKNWERDVHIEFFDTDGTIEFSQDAGLRIHGGKTRQASQKSLRLYARNEYGRKYFNYKVFPQKYINKYKRLILRTTMGSWGEPTIIKDVLAHDIARDLDIEYQDHQPVIVYINGEYWGIHTIRDRIDERYIGYLYDIDHNLVEIKESTNADYADLMSFIEHNDFIAKELGVDRSTIYREVNRNKLKSGKYSAKKADEYSKERKNRFTVNRKFTDECQKKVLEYLYKEWSPEQIVGYCARYNIEMVSHERIYQFIRKDKKEGGKVYTYLRHQLKYRKRPAGKHYPIANRVSIDQRPDVVDEKTRFGDWEMDTIIGANQQGAILTLTERTTNFILMERLILGKNVVGLKNQIINLLLSYKDFVHTITTDNGPEFAQHLEISKKIKSPIYFAHPYCSWEKGSIEHANKLIRQYVKKDSDLNTYTKKQLAKYQHKINNRPRKKLNYDSPKNLFYNLVNGNAAFGS